MPRLEGDVMDRRRVFWLVVWPLVAVGAACVVAVAALAAASLLAEPEGADDAEGVQLVLDRAAASGELAVAELTRSPAELAAVVLAVLAWLVVLGVGAQRYFPEGRRLVTAFGAVLVAGLIVLAVLAQAGSPLTLRALASVAAIGAVVGGLLVFVAAGYRWRAPAPHHHRAPAEYSHLADLL